MKKLIMGLVAVAVLGFSQMAVSQQVFVSEAKVQTVLIDNVNFGGCMILTNKVLSDSGLNCPSRWVSFDCKGSLGGDKDIAYRMLDQAQIAQALDKKISVLVDDAKKLSGYCYASRIDLY